MLLHERFNNKDAVELFNEALQQDPKNAQAIYGLAMVSADGFDDKAHGVAAKAIELDPKLVEAHELLASLALEDDETDEGGEQRRMRRWRLIRMRWMRWRSCGGGVDWRTRMPTRMRGWRRSRR